jgi:putative Holliday junction resolvase
VQQLALQIVLFHPIEIGDADRADARGRQIKRCGTAEAAGADDQDPRRGKFLLTSNADSIQQDVAAVPREFSGRESGQRSGHLPRKRAGTCRAAIEIAPAQLRARNERVRFLGIDYGARRIGLSYGDELGVATPLPALTEADVAKRWAALVALIAQRRITDLVVGYPLNMDHTVGFKAKEVDAFAARLRAETNLPVHLVDERLTSYEAESTIAKSKRRDIRASGVIDSRAATIILQDYLNQMLPPPEMETGE